MAILGNDDRILGDFVTWLAGTPDDDIITLSGQFLFDGTFVGTLDGGNGFDLLQLDAANLGGEEGGQNDNVISISNIEQTVLISEGFYTIEANDIAALGALSLGSGVTQVHLTLPGQNVAPADFSGLTLEDGQILSLGFTTKGINSSPIIDLSSASVAEIARIIYTGDIGSDTYYGSSGEDHVDGFGGVDTLYGFGGDDVLEGRGELYGGSGNDNLQGSGYDDLLSGGLDDDLLQGGAGNDGLLGGPGSDILIGGAGDDQLLGGFGQDVFVWTEIDGGADHVFDFTPYRDNIGFDDSLLNDGTLAPQDVFSAVGTDGGSMLVHDETGTALAFFEDVRPFLLEIAIANAVILDVDVDII